MVRILLAQHFLVELADTRLGHFIDEHDVVGKPPRNKPTREVLDDLSLGNGLTWLDHDTGERPLLSLRVPDSDYDGLSHRGMDHDSVLQVH